MGRDGGPCNGDPHEERIVERQSMTLKATVMLGAVIGRRRRRIRRTSGACSGAAGARSATHRLAIVRSNSLCIRSLCVVVRRRASQCVRV